MIDPDNHFSELWELQSGLCAMCRKPGKSAGLVVDHDHRTALIRGLLCLSCNTLEGMVGDSLEFEAYRLHPPAEGRGWVYNTVFGPAAPERPFTPDELSEEYSRVFPDK